MPRARLFDRLDEAEHTALTLVSAPAGFGKTALLGAWIRERCARPCAWLSLDEGDDDPVRFWSYVVAALQTVDDDLADSALALVHSPLPPSGESIATAVLNDLARSPEGVVCVLDDYHFISAESIHRGLVFLIERMPPNVRLVVTTRADPPWPLARLRAGERMAELRAADLRFTDDEARLFLEAAGLALSVDQIRALDDRTEGWIAGLQMAALSMRDRIDVADFIRDFAGSHHFVLDYLAQEVLDQQPDSTRAFLIQTSILEQLSGDLCDAVTGTEDSQRTLEALRQSNLFTEPLDDERRWYRYHQLFADVLRSRLLEHDEGERAGLHRRASEWLEAEGFVEQAVHHALEGGDVDRATRLIARTASATFMVGSQLLVLEWLRRLPDEEVAATPVLALVDAWARFVTGDWAGMVPALEIASEAIASAAPASEREALGAQLDGIRAWVAYQTGDLVGCTSLASAALERMPEDALVPRRIVASAQGYGFLLLGETKTARMAAAEVVAESRRAGDALTECLALGLEAQARLHDGELVRASRAYERAIDVGTVGDEPLPSASIMQVQLAEILRERDELDEARRVLTASIEACERALGLPEWVFEGNVTLARVLHALGDTKGSDEAAERAERVLEQELIPGGMEPIIGRALGYRARHWLASGDVERASSWIAEQSIATTGALDRARLTSYVLLARALIASGEHESAIRLVDRVSLAAGGSGSVSLAVEPPLVKALALLSAGRSEEATDHAVVALRAAEPEGYVRLFLDDGPPIVQLLEAASIQEPALAGYTESLRSAYAARHGSSAHAAAAAHHGGLDEPLNERELEVLRMFAVGRSNREIAEELYLSVNTVKWHARNLYGKLGVNRRTLAVAKARELGIL